MAIGGSTNGIVHLTAIAGRMSEQDEIEAMTSKELELIRSTYMSMAKDPEAFALDFRLRLVDRDPSLRPVMPAIDRRGATRVVETIGTILSGLDESACASAKAQTAALRLRWPGIQPRHFGAIGQALIEALADRLGTALTEDARVAWSSAYVLLAEALMARCYNPLGLVA